MTNPNLPVGEPVDSQPDPARLRRAERVCRELRFLLSKDGRVDGSNHHRLTQYLLRWLDTCDAENKHDRPGESRIHS